MGALLGLLIGVALSDPPLAADPAECGALRSFWFAFDDFAHSLLYYFSPSLILNTHPFTHSRLSLPPHTLSLNVVLHPLVFPYHLVRPFSPFSQPYSVVSPFRSAARTRTAPSTAA